MVKVSIVRVVRLGPLEEGLEACSNNHNFWDYHWLLKDMELSIALCMGSFNWVTKLSCIIFSFRKVELQHYNFASQRGRESILCEMGYWKMSTSHAENPCVCSYLTLLAIWKDVSQINYWILLSKQTLRRILLEYLRWSPYSAGSETALKYLQASESTLTA